MIVHGDWVVTAADQPPRRDWGVRVVRGQIQDVGPYEELRRKHSGDGAFDASGHVVLPGFVNGHVHMYGVLAHGIPVDQQAAGFLGFLEDYWWPKVEDRLDHDMIAAAADWVSAEMLLGGTTTFLDVLEAPNALPDGLFVEKEIIEARGMRGLLCFEATERSGPETARRGLDENVRLIEAVEDGDLVSGLLCYHTAFTCSAEFITEAFSLAEEHDVLVHAHCNEGTYEGEWCEAKVGKRTMEFYDELGVAGPRLLASQCVQLSEREREIIAERGVRCVHMPLSNCEVGGGIAPVPELLDAGVRVGLGSDGYINDIYEVMHGAFLLHKARLLDPSTMPADRVLHMATAGGAEALGLDRVGRLEPGYSADLQVVSAEWPTPVNEDNLFDQLLLWRNHSHVRDVMVAGRWRVRKGEVLGADMGAMRARLHQEANRLWSM